MVCENTTLRLQADSGTLESKYSAITYIHIVLESIDLERKTAYSGVSIVDGRRAVNMTLRSRQLLTRIDEGEALYLVTQFLSKERVRESLSREAAEFENWVQQVPTPYKT